MICGRGDPAPTVKFYCKRNMTHKIQNPDRNFLRVEIKMNECEVMFFLSWTKSTRQKTGRAGVHFTRVAEICLSGFSTYRYKSIIKYCIFPLGKVT